MLSNDITLDKADGTDVIYRLVSQDQTGTRRVDIGTTMALPGVLIIKHNQTGKSPNVVDRHLVQLNRAVPTALGSVAVNANFTLLVPRDTAVTAAIVHDVIANMVDFLSDGAITGLAVQANIDAILRGES